MCPSCTTAVHDAPRSHCGTQTIPAAVTSAVGLRAWVDRLAMAIPAWRIHRHVMSALSRTCALQPLVSRSMCFSILSLLPSRCQVLLRSLQLLILRSHAMPHRTSGWMQQAQCPNPPALPHLLTFPCSPWLPARFAAAAGAPPAPPRGCAPSLLPFERVRTHTKL